MYHLLFLHLPWHRNNNTLPTFQRMNHYQPKYNFWPQKVSGKIVPILCGSKRHSLSVAMAWSNHKEKHCLWGPSSQTHTHTPPVEWGNNLLSLSVQQLHHCTSIAIPRPSIASPTHTLQRWSQEWLNTAPCGQTDILQLLLMDCIKKGHGGADAEDTALYFNDF